MFSSGVPKQQLEYVRSRELAVFSFFDIDPADALAYQSAMETIDPQFTGEVVIKTFVKTFCPKPTSKYLFKLLWGEYVALMLRRETMGNRGGGGERKVMAGLLENARHSIDQLTFSCFLLLFLSLQTEELSAFIFWLYFVSKGEKKEDQVSQQKLMDLAKVPPIHGSPYDMIDCLQTKLLLFSPHLKTLGKSKSEKERNVLKRRLKALEKLSASIDPTTFKKGKFHLLDLKAGGPFSKPVLALQIEMKKLLLSDPLWKKIAARVHIVRKESLPAKLRMVDKKDTATTIHYKNTGERKKTRKDIASFVKIFQEFSLYILTNDDSVMGKKQGLLSCLFGWISLSRGKDVKISPEESETEADTAPTAAVVDTSSEKIDHLDVVGMSYRYRKQMRWSLSKMYEQTDSSRGVAEEILARCDEEVLSAEEVARLVREERGMEAEENDLNDDDDLDLLDDDDELLLDENGEVVLDENGDPVFIKRIDESGEGEDGIDEGGGEGEGEERNEGNEKGESELEPDPNIAFEKGNGGEEDPDPQPDGS